MSIEMPDRPVRVRIAPSPTGDPHVGTAYIALFNKALALKTGGHFILRIEDTDRARYVAGSEEMIFDSLRWLGIAYDEGPDVGGPFGPYRQSERTAIYRGASATLLASGHAYRCFCTADRLEALRKEQQDRKQPPGYDGLCKSLPKAEAEAKVAAGTPFVVRLAIPDDGETAFADGPRGRVAFQNRDIDDQVLLKSDGFPTYHLANVVDDHAMGVTHVIRAEEWISSTPKHVLLYQAFGWPAPSFLHMPLLRNKDKSKISKRKNPTSLVWYRSQGFLPETMLNFLALMGYSMPGDREVFSFDEFVAGYDLNRLSTTGPVFDLQKLEWLNGEWIRRIPPAGFAARVVAFFGEKYRGREDLVRRVTPIVQERIRRLTEFADYADMFFFPLPEVPIAELTGKASTTATVAALERAIAACESVAAEGGAGGGGAPGSNGSWNAAVLEAACRSAASPEAGLSANALFMFMRVAVTGKRISPPLFESMEILGRDETLARLRKGLARVGAAAR